MYKKRLIIIFLLSILAIGCVRKVNMKVPELTIVPDTVQFVSPIDYATFYISGYGEEDLKRFKITTEPYIFSFDTTFGVFTHVFNKTVSMKAFDNMNIDQDSIITVHFELSDDFNKTTQLRYLRLIEGYPPVKYFFATLKFAQDSNMFFSTSLLKPYNCQNRIDVYVDFIFAVDSDYGFMFCSPDAAYAGALLTNNGCYYNTDNKNHTMISYSTLDINDISPKLLYNITAGNTYIGDNPNYGVGITNLEVGDKIAFITHENRKGLIVIKSISLLDKTITFDLYVQRYPVQN